MEIGLKMAKTRGKAYNTYTAPQAAYRSCIGAYLS